MVRSVEMRLTGVKPSSVSEPCHVGLPENSNTCERWFRTLMAPLPRSARVDATNWGETQKIIEAIHKMPLEGVTSRRDADEV